MKKKTYEKIEKQPLVVVNPAEYGIEESKAAQIAAVFRPMLAKMEELEAEYNEIIKLSPDDKLAQKLAKELRLKYVKVRTGTAEIHKLQKEFYIRGGKFIDGWKNTQAFISHDKEQALENIEKYAEIMENKRLDDREADRIVKLQPYVDFLPQGLRTMADDVFETYLSGTIASYEAKLRAEAEAEKARIEKEKAERLHRERVQKLLSADLYQFLDDKNMDFGTMSESDFTKLVEKLTAEKEAFETEQEQIRIENEKLKKQALIREKLAAAARQKKAAEQAERDAENARIQAAKDAEIEKARQENERLKKQMQAEKEAKEAEEKRLAAAPDKEKMKAFLQMFDTISFPDVTSPEAVEVVQTVNQSIIEIIYAIKQYLR